MTVTAPGGETSHVSTVFIRGNEVVFIMVPPVLSRAPIFERYDVWKKTKGHPPVHGLVAKAGVTITHGRRRNAPTVNAGVYGPSG